MMLFARVHRRTRRATAVALLAAFAFGAAPSNATATELPPFEDYYVDYDQARLLRLQEDVSDVIIGNPSVAAVNIQSRRLLVITGKTFGMTNMILLNSRSEVMAHHRLIVRTDDRKIVNLVRGDKRASFNCVPVCQPVIKVGDDVDHFGAVVGAAAKKSGVATGGE